MQLTTQTNKEKIQLASPFRQSGRSASEALHLGLKLIKLQLPETQNLRQMIASLIRNWRYRKLASLPNFVTKLSWEQLYWSFQI